MFRVLNLGVFCLFCDTRTSQAGTYISTFSRKKRQSCAHKTVFSGGAKEEGRKRVRFRRTAALSLFAPLLPRRRRPSCKDKHQPDDCPPRVKNKRQAKRNHILPVTNLPLTHTRPPHHARPPCPCLISTQHKPVKSCRQAGKQASACQTNFPFHPRPSFSSRAPLSHLEVENLDAKRAPPPPLPPSLS